MTEYLDGLWEENKLAPHASTQIFHMRWWLHGFSAYISGHKNTHENSILTRSFQLRYWSRHGISSPKIMVVGWPNQTHSFQIKSCLSFNTHIWGWLHGLWLISISGHNNTHEYSILTRSFQLRYWLLISSWHLQPQNRGGPAAILHNPKKYILYNRGIISTWREADEHAGSSALSLSHHLAA